MTSTAEMIEAWIAMVHAKKGSPEHERLSWAQGAFWDLCRENIEEAWNAILAIVAAKPDARVFGNLAAGPLEDLLVNHGPQIIERIEQQARLDPSFAALLGGVWKNDIRDDVWTRVEQLRSHVW
ncbi:MAG: DUF6869 domain-containing protein [Gammaproteobacteria bacterium]